MNAPELRPVTGHVGADVGLSEEEQYQVEYLRGEVMKAEPTAYSVVVTTHGLREVLAALDRLVTLRAEPDSVADDVAGGYGQRVEVKQAVEEWFSDISLDDLFMIKGWPTGGQDGG